MLKTRSALLRSLLTSAVLLLASCAEAAVPTPENAAPAIVTVAYKTVKVDGLDIFYREAGPKNAPTLLLLHGFPASSHMFRNLIPALADRYHVVAPDYPGFGQSSMPKVGEFNYTFERLSQVVEGFTQALGLSHYSLYMMDYGAPVGFRLAVRPAQPPWSSHWSSGWSASTWTKCPTPGSVCTGHPAASMRATSASVT